MTELIRPKMHIWGPERRQKVIFTDELADYESRGWRDHPNKVGQPIESIVAGQITPELPKKRGRKPKV